MQGTKLHGTVASVTSNLVTTIINYIKKVYNLEKRHENTRLKYQVKIDKYSQILLVSDTSLRRIKISVSSSGQQLFTTNTIPCSREVVL